MRNTKNAVLYLVTNPSCAAEIQDNLFVRYKLNAYTRVTEILQAHIQNIIDKK